MTYSDNNQQQTTIKSPVHFVGIGGSGMSPLAKIAHAMGLAVTGSDTGSSKALAKMADLGIGIFPQHDASNVAQANTVVRSSAISANNPELLSASEQHKSILHRSDFLQWLMRHKKAITVSGTHGKTTTTAMIAHMLIEIGADPSVAIGGEMLNMNDSARYGAGEYFVAEADESDASFLKYSPYINVVTNIDLDHLDFYGNKTNLIAAFQKYVDKTRFDGACVIGSGCINDLDTRNKRVYAFDLGTPFQVQSAEVKDGKTHLTLKYQGEFLHGAFSFVGQHNILNTLASLSAIEACGLDVKRAFAALETFKGVKRRLTMMHNNGRVVIYDDYAHNPGKIQAVVASLHKAWPEHFLVVVFQGHRYQRLKTMYNSFMESFADADHVVVMPVYAVGTEPPGPGMDPQSIAEQIARVSQVPATPVADFAEASTVIADILAAKDKAIVLTVGAGDVWKLAGTLQAKL